MKKFIALTLGLILISSPILAATYTEYEEKDSELRVGIVQFKQYSMEKLLQEKEEIEEDYARATVRYNASIVKINLLITEAQRLGL